MKPLMVWGLGGSSQRLKGLVLGLGPTLAVGACKYQLHESISVAIRPADPGGVWRGAYYQGWSVQGLGVFRALGFQFQGVL